MKVLVAGATGFVGSHLVPALIAEGHEVRCLTRDPARATLRLPSGAGIVRGDVHDAASLRDAMRGIDFAYYLVHSMEGSEFGFEERDRDAARNFAAAAAENHVRRIVFLGGLGDEASQLSAHLRSRHEVGVLLRAGPTPVTEFRAGLIIGAGSASFVMLSQLVERLPLMITPRWVDTLTQPIAIDDIVRYLVEAAAQQDGEDRMYEVGGGEVMTYRSMMERYARARGLRRFMIPAPVLTPRLSSYWVDVITDVDAALARPLIEGLSSEMVVRDASAVSVFGPPRVTFEEAIGLAAKEDPGRHEAPLVWLRRLPRHLGSFARRRAWPPVYVDAQVRRSGVPADALWESVVAIGGREGYPVAGSLWRVRGWMDRMLGGPGIERTAAPASKLRPGDRVDFWEVLEHEPPRRLRMRALMKMPGSAELEFHVEADGGQTVLAQTARFLPAGIFGRLYWWALYPFHVAIFHGMASRIVSRAQTRLARRTGPGWDRGAS